LPATKRLITGGWVLGALLLLWYNALQLTSLFDEPIPGISREARETIRKWQRLEQAAADRIKSAVKDLDVSRIADQWKAVQASKQTAAPAAETKPVPRALPAPPEKVVLPSVTGIMKRHDANGREHWAAMVDGRVRRENDRVKDFVVAQIDENGVVVTKGERRWRLPPPDVAFSVDQGQ